MKGLLSLGFLRFSFSPLPPLPTTAILTLALNCPTERLRKSMAWAGELGMADRCECSKHTEPRGAPSDDVRQMIGQLMGEMRQMREVQQQLFDRFQGPGTTNLQTTNGKGKLYNLNSEGAMYPQYELWNLFAYVFYFIALVYLLGIIYLFLRTLPNRPNIMQLWRDWRRAKIAD
ncbi:hypothetical protein P154DRAFT_558138 [Amniculicola lignicola CBS 123094]|uniref:Uncharacterized protein n=1 Tax=Amniculicola lignicola CBS 123094 TaxID=1392246 RepID=A0A6A5X453_9PLEO|nr:hypothetical protein P154DRAFT_558138 [Amniculicola lignicola CBS 123094]